LGKTQGVTGVASFVGLASSVESVVMDFSVRQINKGACGLFAFLE